MTGKRFNAGESEDALKNSRIYSQYRALNNSLEELAAVNKALQTTQTGTLTANNLLDQRDLILHDIAQFVDITVDEKANGSVNVYMGDVALVKGAVVTGSLDIETAKHYCDNHGIIYPDNWTGENAVVSIVSKQQDGTQTVIVDNANDIITGGALGGLIHSATDYNDGSVNAGTVQESLNKLAQALADIFNNLNTRTNAYCIDPTDTNHLKATDTTNLIFVGSDGTGQGVTAGNIKLSDSMLTKEGIWNISCAYFADPADYDINAVGNSQNVVAMLNTRSQKQAELDGMSVEDFYSSLLGGIASAGDSAQTLYETQCDVVESLENQLDSAYGVDLNEELVDLVKYQTAYAAAAQVFNVVNSCLDTLMTLGR